MRKPRKELAAILDEIRSGHPVRVTRALEKLGKYPDGDPGVWELRVHAHMALGQFDDALESARRASEVRGGDDYYLGMYADLLAASEEHSDEGVQMLRELVAKGTREPENYLALSERSLLSGKLVEAAAVIEKGLNISKPEALLPVFYFHHTIAYLLGGDTGQAKDSMLKALSAILGRQIGSFRDVPVSALESIVMRERIPRTMIEPFTLAAMKWVAEARAKSLSSTEDMAGWDDLPLDDEPLSPEEESAMNEGWAALHRGDQGTSLEDLEREFGLG
jgi:tetratricopeptide (TPR) repeat protein